jgi:hypothetical protein
MKDKQIAERRKRLAERKAGNVAIGQRIRAARVASGLTIEDAAGGIAARRGKTIEAGAPASVAEGRASADRRGGDPFHRAGV